MASANPADCGGPWIRKRNSNIEKSRPPDVTAVPDAAISRYERGSDFVEAGTDLTTGGQNVDSPWE